MQLRDARVASPRHWAEVYGLVGFFTAAMVMFVSSGESAVVPWINHDAANALYIGGRMLHGDVLYVDWYYFVMPSIVVWSAGVYLISELSGLSPATAIHCVLIATTGLGVAVLHRAFPKPSPQSLLMSLAYLSILVYPGLRSADLGQREHLFVLLLVPYVVWRLSQNPPSAWVLALLMYLGFTMMIKPHFIAVIAVTELFFIRKRDHRTAVWVALVVGGVVPFAVLAVHSGDAIIGFFERAIPYHLSGSYEHYGGSFERFAGSRRHLTLLLMTTFLAATVVAALRRGALERWKAVAVVTIAVALYATVLHQGKFYAYHTLPLYGVTLTLAALVIGQFLSVVEHSALRRGATGLVAVGLLILIASGFRNTHGLLRVPPIARNVELFPYLAHQRQVMLMTPVVEGDFFRYLLSHDLDIMGPWSSNYTVAGLLAIADPEERSAALKAYFEPLRANLAQQKPDLVLFSPIRYPPRGPSLHEVFVKEYATFPTPSYEFFKRTDRGWILYRRTQP